LSGQRGYVAAGAVLTYLLDLGETARLRQLWGSVNRDSSASDFSNALQRIYGLALDDVWQDLLTRRHRPYAPVWLCAMPEMTDDEADSLRVSCTGKTLGRTTSGNLRLHTPAYGSDVDAMLSGPAGSNHTPVVTGAALIPCDGNPQSFLPRSPQMQHREFEADTWIPALPAPQVFTMEAYAWIFPDLPLDYQSPTGQLAYRTSSLAPATTSCPDAQANLVGPSTVSALWMPKDGQTRYARFTLQDPGASPVLSVYATPDGLPPPRVTVALCQDCSGASASCNGCLPGGPDCIVQFTNASALPTWLVLSSHPSLDAGGGLDASNDGEVRE
jgi:hypothetical protein